jgi:hypothetical protein
LNDADLSKVLSQLQSLWMKYYPETEVYSFATDVSPITKPFSKKSAERQYVNVPNNVVPGNKSLSIGYKYSYVNLGYTPAHGGSRWSLPLSVGRVSLDSDDISMALAQIPSLMADDLLPFSTAKMIKNSADSAARATSSTNTH